MPVNRKNQECPWLSAFGTSSDGDVKYECPRRFITQTSIMATVEQEIASLIDVLSIAKQGTYISAAMSTALLYDTLIFFESEFKIVWKAKWSFGKALYIPSRYLSLLFEFVMLVTTLLDTSFSPTLCGNIFRLSIWLPILSSIAIQGLMVLRTAAIYGDHKNMKRLIYALWVADSIVLLYSLVSTLIEEKEIVQPFHGGSCAFNFSGNLNQSTVILFASDFAIQFLMWFLASVRIFRLVIEGRSKLGWLIFRDTFFILPVNFMLTFSGFISLLRTPKQHQIIVMNITGVILGLASIASTRAIFNLQEFVSRGEHGTHKLPVTTEISQPQMMFRNPTTFMLSADTEIDVDRT